MLRCYGSTKLQDVYKRQPLYRRAIRVSMGTVFQVPWAYFPKYNVGSDNTFSDASLHDKCDSSDQNCSDRNSSAYKYYIDVLHKLGFKTCAMALTDDSVSIDDPCLLYTSKKAEDITVLDIGEVSSIADYFIIANGNNANQLTAMEDAVDEAMYTNGVHQKQVEGTGNSTWILMDYQDIIVHLFSKEDRQFYDLDRIWRDGKVVDVHSCLLYTSRCV